MELQTSTPLVIRNFEPCVRKSPASNENWNSRINCPQFFDFVNGISGDGDSYFNSRQSLLPTPIKYEGNKRGGLLGSETDDIIRSLQNCSISTINDTTGDESTLVPAECTVQLFERSRQSTNELKVSGNLRKECRQSFTAPKPFNFELRNKERQEYKESKKLFLMNVLEEANKKQNLFKAKPAPKFNTLKAANKPAQVTSNHQQKPKNLVPTKANIVVKKIKKPDIKIYDTNNVIINNKQSHPPARKMNNNACNGIKVSDEKKLQAPIKAMTNPIKKIPDKQNHNPAVNKKKLISAATTRGISHAINKKKSPVSVKLRVPLKKAERLKSPKINRALKSVDVKKIEVTENGVDGAKNNSQHCQNSHKQKPYSNQATVPNRKLLVGREPILRTAQRALDRQRFEDRIKDRAEKLEQYRKKEEAEKAVREKQETIKFRKQLVHRAKPAPTFNNNNILDPSKRALVDPLLPIFVKRRKIDKTTRQ